MLILLKLVLRLEVMLLDQMRLSSHSALVHLYPIGVEDDPVYREYFPYLKCYDVPNH